MYPEIYVSNACFCCAFHWLKLSVFRLMNFQIWMLIDLCALICMQIIDCRLKSLLGFKELKHGISRDFVLSQGFVVTCRVLLGKRREKYCWSVGLRWLHVWGQVVGCFEFQPMEREDCITVGGKWNLGHCGENQDYSHRHNAFGRFQQKECEIQKDALGCRTRPYHTSRVQK